MDTEAARAQIPCRRPRRAHLVAVICGSLLAMTGCSFEEPGVGEPGLSAGEGSDELATSRGGVVLVERERDTPTLSLRAQFLELRGLDEERALAALGMWRPDRSFEIDSCRQIASGAPPRHPERVEMRLREVGALTVEGRHGRALAHPRRIPDGLSVVSGVTYEEEITAGNADSGPQRYRVRAPGSTPIGALDVTVEAPTSIEIFEPSDGVTRRSLGDGEFALRWRTDADVSTGEVYLELTHGSALEVRGSRLRCRLEDDGRFALPAELLDPLFESGDSVYLELRRASTVRTHVEGLGPVDVIISSRDARTIDR
jgi:hypothetical protein